MIDEVVLHGALVRLEPLGYSHVPGLLAAATGVRDSFSFTDVPADERSMRTYVERALAGRDAGTTAPYATIDLPSGRVVGTTRFGDIEHWPWPPGDPRQRGLGLPDAVEIGWTWLSPHAQRTGHNHEAKLLMLTHAFEVWRVRRVRFRADSRNERSRVALIRLGASLDGIIRAAQLGYDGEVRDNAWYSILDSEWDQVKARLTA